MSKILTELKRRNVIRVTVAYVIVAWLIAQVSDLALENVGSPDWVIKTILLLLIMGLPLAIVLAWAFELTPDGIQCEAPDPQCRHLHSSLTLSRPFRPRICCRRSWRRGQGLGVPGGSLFQGVQARSGSSITGSHWTNFVTIKNFRNS